jgi:hypothetical protein
MIDLPYALVIEATADPNFFGFYSPDLEGFTGVGHNVQRARPGCDGIHPWGLAGHDMSIGVNRTSQG